MCRAQGQTDRLRPFPLRAQPGGEPAAKSLSPASAGLCDLSSMSSGPLPTCSCFSRHHGLEQHAAKAHSPFQQPAKALLLFCLSGWKPNVQDTRGVFIASLFLESEEEGVLGGASFAGLVSGGTSSFEGSFSLLDSEAGGLVG